MTPSYLLVQLLFESFDAPAVTSFQSMEHLERLFKGGQNGISQVEMVSRVVL